MVYQSPVTDPWWNLAAEQHFLTREPLQEPLLLLWQSVPSVIIGRYQNPWAECDVETLKRESVLLVRRPSGGGAVYHDLGNLNYCVISRRASYTKEYMLTFVTAVLDTFGIEAHPSGRSDLTSCGRKFSGSAFRYTSALAMHHGTLLVSADLDQMHRCLTPDRSIGIMKGIRSQASPVVNLAELAPGMSCTELSDRLADGFPRWFRGSAEVHELTPKCVDVRREQDELAGWEWIYGRTPEFTRTFSLSKSSGPYRASVTVSKGIITGITLEDAPSAPSVTDDLIGRRFDEQEMEAWLTSQ